MESEQFIESNNPAQFMKVESTTSTSDGRPDKERIKACKELASAEMRKIVCIEGTLEGSEHVFDFPEVLIVGKIVSKKIDPSTGEVVDAQFSYQLFEKQDERNRQEFPIMKFVTWNIDQAKREEGFEETKFNNRFPSIMRQIKASNADILCIQEMRNLQSSDISVNLFLFEVSQLGYDYKHAYYGAEEFSFCQAIFYRRSKFFVTGMDLQVMPGTPKDEPDKTRVLLVLQLQCRVTKQKFFVSTTHFGMEEQEKNKATDFLLEYTKENLSDYPYLCAGDYNFFDDKEGKEQRAKLLEQSNDLAYPLNNASGTFMGYAHDAFCYKDINQMSRLDHVFCHKTKVERVEDSATALGDMSLVKTYSYPSDHLMVSFYFFFPPL